MRVDFRGVAHSVCFSVRVLGLALAGLSEGGETNVNLGKAQPLTDTAESKLTCQCLME
jgi:hypothetical protein